MATGIENPYATPQEASSRPFIQSVAEYRRSQFSYVLGTIFVLASVLTLMILPRFAVSPEAGLLFWGVLLLGPFAVVFHEPWLLGSPQLAASVIIILATSCYLLVPRKSTFVISMLSAVVWVFYGALLAFQILAIRVG